MTPLRLRDIHPDDIRIAPNLTTTYPYVDSATGRPMLLVSGEDYRNWLAREAKEPKQEARP